MTRSDKVSPSSSPSIEEGSSGTEHFKVYKERWIMLLTITTLIWSNITQWVAYSALVDQTNMFYCGPIGFKDCPASFLSNQIYQIVAVIFSIVGMYSATKFGILPTLRISALCNITGSTIRLIASIPLIHSFPLRQVLMLTGTSIAAISQMYFVVFSKVAESWFFPRHRASATVACSNSLIFGVVVGTLLPSLIIPNDTSAELTSSWNFFVLNSILFFLCGTSSLICLIPRRSVPKTPPSASSEQEVDISVSSGVKTCLKNTQFLVQIFNFVINFAIVNGVIFASDIINYQGYNLKGYPIAISTSVSVFSAYFVGIIADKTRKFKEITMISSVIMALACLGIRLYLLKKYSGWYDSVIICAFLSIMMSCCSVQIPIGNEMGVETTFPVHESISSGVLNTFGQAWLFGFYFILYALKQTTIIYDSKPGQNWRISMDFWVLMSVINSIITILFLKPRYNRLEFENKEM